MDTKANLSNRRKINDLAIQHNKLTTLVACLLNEVNALKRELHDSRGSESNSRTSDNSHNGRSQSNSNKFSNFNDLKAEDILKQLSINTVDN
jgi:hypothetical protein